MFGCWSNFLIFVFPDILLMIIDGAFEVDNDFLFICVLKKKHYHKSKKIIREKTNKKNWNGSWQAMTMAKKMFFFCFVLLMKIAAGINWDTLHLGEKRKGNNNNNRKPDDHQTLIVKVFDFIFIIRRWWWSNLFIMMARGLCVCVLIWIRIHNFYCNRKGKKFFLVKIHCVIFSLL